MVAGLTLSWFWSPGSRPSSGSCAVAGRRSVLAGRRPTATAISRAQAPPPSSAPASRRCPPSAAASAAWPPGSAPPATQTSPPGGAPARWPGTPGGRRAVVVATAHRKSNRQWEEVLVWNTSPERNQQSEHPVLPSKEDVKNL